MSETVFVTGATGLAGANICKLLIERGDGVRALARPSADTGPLVALGVEIVNGDVTDAADVFRAATGADSAIHCAALLGGASQNLPDFEAVNVRGTKHVLDAAEALGMRRVVAVSTGTFFDTAGGLEREDAPVMKDPSSRSRRWRHSKTPWRGPRPATMSSPPTRAPSSGPLRCRAMPSV
jgi:dihydroflavonol-4-reductase